MATPMQSTPGQGGDAGTPHPHINPAASTSDLTTARPHDPIEMTELDAAKGTSGAGSHLLNDVAIPTTSPITDSFAASNPAADTNDENTKPVEPAASAMATSSSNPPVEPTDPIASASPAVITSSPSAPAASRSRMDSVAIGPETTSTPTVAVASDAGPVLVITLLLTSGARHPYKIDERYLIKRGVNVPEETENGRKDPFSISVYTLKELILREWREEWEPQPSSPSSIRLIYFGRLLDDKSALKECKFNADSANVVHMTVRPQDLVDEEDASKSKAQQREQDSENTAGCRCVIL